MHQILSLFLIAILFTSTISSSYLITNNVEYASAQVMPDEITDIANYVVYGLEKVEIDKGVTIQSGNVGLHDDSKKKGELKIKKGVEFIDSESSVIANKIKIEKDAIAPNVYYNELKNKGTILGTENTPLDLPVVNNLHEFPDFESGNEDIKVNKNDSVTLESGDYGKIKLKKDAMIIFEGGEYNIESITAGKYSQILFKDSSEVRVEKDVKLDKLVTLGPHPDSNIEASDIVFFVGDDKKKSKIEFGKSSVIHANFFSPNGEIKMKKETSATGSFIAKTVKIDKNSNLALSSSDGSIPIEDLIEEYRALIEKLDLVGNNIGETVITQEFIDETKNDLDRIKQIALELQFRDYDGLIDAEFQGGDVIGTITFFDEVTLEVLFETIIPNGVMAIFTGFGMLEEFEENNVEQTFEQIADLINSSGVIYETITTIQSEEDALNFALSNMGQFHPSTGETINCISPGQCALKITYEIAKCLIGNLSCRTGIIGGVALLQSGQVEDVIPYFFPLVTINVKQFNDIDGDGELDSGEEGAPGWEFSVRTFDSEDLSIIDSILDPFSLLNDPTKIITNETIDTIGIVSFVELSIPRSTASITVSQTPQDGWRSTSSDGVDRFLDFDAETDISFIGDVKVYDTEFFGNEKVGTIRILVAVNNDNGGTLEPNNFTVDVDGGNPSPDLFKGVDGEFIEVKIGAGSYSVNILPVSDYVAEFSPECNGIITVDDVKTCIIDTDDQLPPLSPINIINVSPGFEGDACNIDNALSKDGEVASMDLRGVFNVASLPGTGNRVGGCIAADFGSVQDLGEVTITAGRDHNACGKSCVGTSCSRSGDLFHVFQSVNLSTYSFISSSPALPIDQTLDDYSFTLTEPARYVTVCRGGGGVDASDIMVDSIVARP